MRLLVVAVSPPESSRSRAAVAQQRAPAAGTRIAAAGTVGVDLDARQEARRAAGSARPPITAVRMRARSRTGVIEYTRLRACSR